MVQTVVAADFSETARPTDSSRRHAIGYFDFEDRLGVIGRGRTLDQAFEAAANAVFAVMYDQTSVHPERSCVIEFTETDPEQALVTWLNQVLTVARKQGIVMCRFQLRHVDNVWTGVAWGGPRQEGRPFRRQVRAATTEFVSVTPAGDGWEARCVVDW
jgi:SHS2 domain-containing protein